MFFACAFNENCATHLLLLQAMSLSSTHLRLCSPSFTTSVCHFCHSYCFYCPSGDRLVKVNGASIIGKAYCEVITLIQDRWDLPEMFIVDYFGHLVYFSLFESSLFPQQWWLSWTLCDAKRWRYTTACKFLFTITFLKMALNLPFPTVLNVCP